MQFRKSKSDKSKSNKSTLKFPHLIIILALILTASFMLSACGDDNEDVSDQAATDRVDETPEPTREEMRQAVEPGDSEEFLGAEADIPEDFPSDGYIPEDATVTLVTSSPEDDSFYNVSMESQKLVDEVVEDYKEKMEDAGWQLDNEMENDGDKVLSYIKDDRSASVSAADTDGITLITLHIDK